MRSDIPRCGLRSGYRMGQASLSPDTEDTITYEGTPGGVYPSLRLLYETGPDVVFPATISIE